MGNSIISISMKDRLLEEIDSLQEELGFSGRSELIRAGLRMLISDRKQKGELTGNVSAVLVVVHEEGNELEVTRHKHEFDEIIKTHLHSNLKKNCMDLFILDGDAKQIVRLAESMRKVKNIEYVKLIVS